MTVNIKSAYPPPAQSSLGCPHDMRIGEYGLSLPKEAEGNARSLGKPTILFHLHPVRVLWERRDPTMCGTISGLGQWNGGIDWRPLIACPACIKSLFCNRLGGVESPAGANASIQPTNLLVSRGRVSVQQNRYNKGSHSNQLLSPESRRAKPGH